MSATRSRPPSTPRAERDDAELVRETLAGDAHAFDELLERYQGKIYNLALQITGNRQDAKDAAQTAFLKVYQNLSRFDPSHKFFSWIYRIASNAALDIARREQRDVSLEIDATAATPGPHRRAASVETARAIRGALAQLSPEMRVTIVLRHFHGLTYQEMSDIVGVPVGRIKSRLFSARVRLRELLVARGERPGGD